MKKRLLGFWALVRATIQKWQEDNASELGAALAYFTMVSLAPLLLVVVAGVGFFLGEGAVRTEIVSQVGQVVGGDGAQFVDSMISSLSVPSNNLLAALIALVTALLAALGVFVQLQSSLNRIWRVQLKPKAGIKGLIMTRVVSFLLMLGVGLLLLGLLVLNSILPAILAVVNNLLPVAEHFPLLRALNLGLTFGVLVLLFAMIYRLLPDAQIQWRDVWVGAAVTALLFTLGQLVLGIYFSYSTVGSAYGAAGSFVVILVWVYYSAQILMLGAEFTAVFAERSGRQILPARNAVRVVIETREIESGEKVVANKGQNESNREQG